MRTSNSNKIWRLCTSGILIASALLGSHAYAQQLEEVIVTAERKAESLQDVPVAVTAFSSDRVETLKLEGFEDLSLKIPGFSVNSFSKTRVNPALRGGSSSLSSAGAEQAVGLFIDDVYFGGAGDFELDLFDIERIEVLRGPQGTLFGRNTTGGLINVVTKDPSDEVEGKFKASLGNYAHMQLGAYIAGPMADNLSGSIALISNKRDGTSINTVTGNDVDDLNRSAFRGKLVWRPDDDLEVKFALGYNTSDETGIARDAVSPRSTVDLEPLASQGFMIDDDPRKVQMFSDGGYESEQWVGSLHITKDFDAMTFQSITTARAFDADQDPVSLAGVPTIVYAFADGRDTTSYTQEFRLISNTDSALSWQAGVFFFDAEETRNLHAISVWSESVVGGAFSSLFGCPDQTEEDFNNFAVTPACLVNNPELFDENEYFIDETVETTSMSVYAQGTYDISSQLALTLGGRYTKDEKELNGVTSGEYEWFWNPTPGRVVNGVSEDWGEFTWRAVLDYKATDDILLYSSASTGFRSGAFDMAQSDPDLVDKAVDPETVISYELGAKTRLFDDRVQLNIALFNTTYEDLQFFVNAVGSGGVSTTTNAGEASVEGVEVDLAWAVSEELILSLGYSHQRGDSKGIPADAEIPEGTPPQGTVPNSYVAALDYTSFLADGGEFYAHIDYLKKDEYSLEFIDNDIPQFRSEVDGQINANLGYRSESGWGIQAWVKNLTDENVVLYGQDFWFSLYNSDSVGANADLFDSSFGPRYTAPRTYGMTFSYEFQ
ncbi:TonB-dependent receptor [Pseudomonadales bacterium]|nr:TonB-dependent receptor [Pseudomonadales bacterium]